MGYCYFPPMFDDKKSVQENAKILRDYDKKVSFEMKIKFSILAIGAALILAMICAEAIYAIP